MSRSMEGRRERKKQVTKAALLRHAFALFVERGIEETRVQDITDQADLGKGAFYNYFKSKLALVAELVDDGVRVLREDYLALLPRDAPLEQRVDALARALQRFFFEHPEYVVLFHQARGLLQLKRKGVDRIQEVFISYLKCIGESLAPESGGAAHSEAELMDIAASMAGAIAGYRSMRLAAGLSPRSETIGQVLMRGVPSLMRQRERQ